MGAVSCNFGLINTVFITLVKGRKEFSSEALAMARQEDMGRDSFALPELSHGHPRVLAPDGGESAVRVILFSTSCPFPPKGLTP